MHPTLLLAALIGLAPAATGAGAPAYTAKSSLTTFADPYLDIYSTPRGVGYDGVAGLLIDRPNGTFLCTGSLVGEKQRHIVTAAHCLVGATSIDAVFFPPSGGTLLRTSTDYAIRSGYTDNVIDESDIGVIDLGSDGWVPEIESYDLFTGNMLGETYNQVGFGALGTGATGTVVPGGLRRQGINRIDFSGADPIFGDFWDEQDILFADFDNGNPAQDASCRLTAFFTAENSEYCNLGLGALEVLSAPGDSGGPLLVGGQLAAVASFGLTFNGGLIGDIDPFLNSSFGELAGFVPIAAHADWIMQQVVPEPTTLLLLLTGLVGFALVQRRRPTEEA